MSKMKELWTKRESVIDKVRHQASLGFREDVLVDTVLKQWSMELGQGNLYDDLRSVVDQYRQDNSNLQETIEAQQEIIDSQKRLIETQKTRISVLRLQRGDTSKEEPKRNEGGFSALTE